MITTRKVAEKLHILFVYKLHLTSIIRISGGSKNENLTKFDKQKGSLTAVFCPINNVNSDVNTFPKQTDKQKR